MPELQGKILASDLQKESRQSTKHNATIKTIVTVGGGMDGMPFALLWWLWIYNSD
jgi:hypothetical protein